MRYRASDTTLKHDVAVKILPDAFGADAERLARFTRKTQTLAALDYHCVAQNYWLETHEGEMRTFSARRFTKQ